MLGIFFDSDIVAVISDRIGSRCALTPGKDEVGLYSPWHEALTGEVDSTAGPYGKMMLSLGHFYRAD